MRTDIAANLKLHKLWFNVIPVFIVFIDIYCVTVAWT